MTTPEFSNEFDVLYNNVMSNQAPGLNEYEKSLFLTKAQNEILLSYFLPEGNKYGKGFDGNEIRQISFNELICTERTGLTKNTSLNSESEYSIFDSYNNAIYTQTPLAEDKLAILNEHLLIKRNNKHIPLVVIPLHYKEVSKLMSKPYKRPLKNQAWRITDNSNKTISWFLAGSKDVIDNSCYYFCRYLRKPNPIILEDLDVEGLSIEGVSTVSECELDSILHHDILQRAVELAKAAYNGTLQDQVTIGNVSSTGIGIIPKQ